MGKFEIGVATLHSSTPPTKVQPISNQSRIGRKLPTLPTGSPKSNQSQTSSRISSRFFKFKPISNQFPNIIKVF